jgi:hypothetical protein
MVAFGRSTVSELGASHKKSGRVAFSLGRMMTGWLPKLDWVALALQLSVAQHPSLTQLLEIPHSPPHSDSRSPECLYVGRESKTTWFQKNRSAITGQFVTASHAKKHPRTTVTDSQKLLHTAQKSDHTVRETSQIIKKGERVVQLEGPLKKKVRQAVI